MGIYGKGKMSQWEEGEEGEERWVPTSARTTGGGGDLWQGVRDTIGVRGGYVRGSLGG